MTTPAHRLPASAPRLRLCLRLYLRLARAGQQQQQQLDPPRRVRRRLPVRQPGDCDHRAAGGLRAAAREPIWRSNPGRPARLPTRPGTVPGQLTMLQKTSDFIVRRHSSQALASLSLCDGNKEAMQASGPPPQRLLWRRDRGCHPPHSRPRCRPLLQRLRRVQPLLLSGRRRARCPWPSSSSRPRTASCADTAAR